MKPAVTVDGKTLTQGTDFTVGYSNNVNVGVDTAKAVITGIGDYEGTVRVPFSIVPAQQAAPTLTFANGSLVVAWPEDANAAGYKVTVSKSSTLNPSAKSTVSTVFEAGTVTSTFAQPASGETWYVAVRAVISSDGTASGTLCGSFSEIVKIKMP